MYFYILKYFIKGFSKAKWLREKIINNPFPINFRFPLNIFRKSILNKVVADTNGSKHIKPNTQVFCPLFPRAIITNN